MKYTITVDESREEEVLIFVHRKTAFVEELEQLLQKEQPQLLGFREGECVILSPHEVYCFTVENGKVYALTESEKFALRLRLYQVEEKVGGAFVKINQSCLANLKKVKKFDASLGGTLQVVFKNGYVDYVSRRNLKQVKERLGM